MVQADRQRLGLVAGEGQVRGEVVDDVLADGGADARLAVERVGPVEQDVSGGRRGALLARGERGGERGDAPSSAAEGGIFFPALSVAPRSGAPVAVDGAVVSALSSALWLCERGRFGESTARRRIVSAV